MSRPHIVIVGAGFGGVYSAQKLAPFVEQKILDVTIINRTNYFLFTPLLHEVATGGLRPTSVSESLREIFENTQVSIFQTEVFSVNQDKKTILTKEKEIAYDYLVIATGAETNYYDITGAKENTLPLKNLMDAANIRNKIINSFEEACLTEDDEKRKKLLTFVVIGGGSTGVETVAEMAEFIGDIKSRFYRKNKKYHVSGVSLILVNSGKEIIKMFNEKIRKIAEKRLKKIGVELFLEAKVTSVEKDKINFLDGKKVEANTIIWVAGVKPTTPKFLENSPLLESDRVLTDQFLRAKGQNNIFVLGDSARTLEKNGNPLPMLAQVAVNQAEIVAKNIVATIENSPLKPFTYHSRGNMISLGQWFAAGEIFGITIYGKITWWIWRTVYLFNFASWKKRIHIIFEWTIDLFYPRDITKII